MALQAARNNLAEETRKALRYESWINAEKDRMAKLKGEMSTLEARVYALQEEKEALQSDLDNIKAESSTLPVKHQSLRATHQALEARHAKLQHDYDALVQTHDKCRERTKKSVEKMAEIERASAQQVATAKAQAEESARAARRDFEKREDKLRKELREKGERLTTMSNEAAQAKDEIEALQIEVDNLKQEKLGLEQTIARQIEDAQKADERPQRKVPRPAESKSVEDERLRANHNADQLMRLVKELEKRALQAGVPPSEVMASQAELTVEQSAKAVRLLGTVVSRIHYLARQEVRQERAAEIERLRQQLSEAQSSERHGEPDAWSELTAATPAATTPPLRPSTKATPLQETPASVAGVKRRLDSMAPSIAPDTPSQRRRVDSALSATTSPAQRRRADSVMSAVETPVRRSRASWAAFSAERTRSPSVDLSLADYEDLVLRRLHKLAPQDGENGERNCGLCK